MPAAEPKLLDRLRDACRVRHYSIRTEDAYHDWCRRFILFHNKRHDRISARRAGIVQPRATPWGTTQLEFRPKG